MSNPLRTPSVFNYVLIDGIPTPGLCEVTGADYDQDVEIKQGKGSAGASITVNGEKGVEFKITVKLFTAAQYDAYDEIDLRLRNSKDKAKAVPVNHPWLEWRNITSAITQKAGQRVHKGGGLYEAEIAMVGFKPPPPRNATYSPTAAPKTPGKGPLNGAAEEDAPTAQERELARLLDIAEEP